MEHGAYAALFDDIALWEAADSDACILQLAGEMVQSLGVDSLAKLQDAGGNSLLHLAALWDHAVVLEAAVRAGSSLNAVNLVCA